MALKLGTGAEQYAPLAKAIIGGLTSSVLLTIFIVPAAYLLVYGKKNQPPGNATYAGDRKMNQKLSTIMRVHPLLLCTALSFVWPLAQSRAQAGSEPSTDANSAISPAASSRRHL